jgi:general secretion pathway protein G
MKIDKPNWNLQTETKPRTKLQSGYTLMELLVVMAIIAVITAGVAMNYSGVFGGAKSKAAGADVVMLSSVVERFYLDTGRYPTTAEGLPALVVAPAGLSGWNGPYLRQGRLPDDPWKNPYIYQSPSSGKFTIRSLGADNKVGGDGQNQDHISGS